MSSHSTGAGSGDSCFHFQLGMSPPVVGANEVPISSLFPLPKNRIQHGVIVISVAGNSAHPQPFLLHV